MNKKYSEGRLLIIRAYKVSRQKKKNKPDINTQPDGAAPISDFAIVQSSYGNTSGQMASYGYPATSADETGSNKGNEADKWVITPVANIKGVLGRVDINFPVDIERNILIYKQSDNKFLTSVSRYSLTVSLNLAFSIAGHGAILFCSAVSRYTQCA